MMNSSRKDTIMADSAYVILSSSIKNNTGNFYIDDEVLSSVGVTDFSIYKMNPNIKDWDLAPDFFV